MELLSKFPANYLEFYLYGIGYSGVIVAFLNVITLIFGQDPEQSVFIYFNICILFLLITFTLLWYSKFTQVYNYYVEDKVEDNKRNSVRFSEIIKTGKNIWPAIAVFNIVVGTTVSVHPALTSLVISENYGHGNIWYGKYKL